MSTVTVAPQEYGIKLRLNRRHGESPRSKRALRRYAEKWAKARGLYGLASPDEPAVYLERDAVRRRWELFVCWQAAELPSE